MSFEESITELREELNLKYPAVRREKRMSNEERRLELIEKIQLTVWKVMGDVAKGQAPVFHSEGRATWEDCYFDGREIYYQNLRIFKSQSQVDSGMREICSMLKAGGWELKVSAAPKGTVAGPLVLTLPKGELLDCGRPGGACIPSNVLQIEKVSSSATWALIVEKDACFQRLLDIRSANNLDSCILITGKGFPDVNSRILVCKLWEHLRIPILALVDGDPHGFEIMCVYRFGSLSMSPHSGHLACPAVRWLGVHPSDIRPLLLDSKPLSPGDRKKIRLLLRRGYVKEDENLKYQLTILLEENAKAEIESVTSISNNYLTNVYVRNKIQCKEFL